MEGKEADLGVSSPFIGPDPSDQPYHYNDQQMRDMGAAAKGRPQALAQVKGRPLSGRAAVQAAAANPGGLLHGDDAFVRVGTGQVLTPQQLAKAARGDELREAQQLRALAARRGRFRSPPVHYKGSDAEVPVTQIKAETFPLMNLASEDSNGVPSAPTANKLLAKEIRESRAGDGNYIDTTEGTMTGDAPLTQVVANPSLSAAIVMDIVRLDACRLSVSVGMHAALSVSVWGCMQSVCACVGSRVWVRGRR